MGIIYILRSSTIALRFFNGDSRSPILYHHSNHFHPFHPRNRSKNFGTHSMKTSFVHFHYHFLPRYTLQFLLFSDGLESQRDELERDLKALRRSLFSKNNDSEENDTNALSMRKENIKYYEFCQQHNIQSKDKNGGWIPKEHRLFTTLGMCYIVQQLKKKLVAS